MCECGFYRSTFKQKKKKLSKFILALRKPQVLKVLRKKVYDLDQLYSQTLLTEA